MSQFELIFDNNQPQFEQICSFFQELLTNPTFQEGIREVNEQERMSEVNEMEEVFKRSF
jgi:hypothetical protein